MLRIEKQEVNFLQYFAKSNPNLLGKSRNTNYLEMAKNLFPMPVVVIDSLDFNNKKVLIGQELLNQFNSLYDAGYARPIERRIEETKITVITIERFVGDKITDDDMKAYKQFIQSYMEHK